MLLALMFQFFGLSDQAVADSGQPKSGPKGCKYFRVAISAERQVHLVWASAVKALMYCRRLISSLPKRAQILPSLCICRHGLLCTNLDVTQKKDETGTIVG